MRCLQSTKALKHKGLFFFAIRTGYRIEQTLGIIIWRYGEMKKFWIRLIAYLGALTGLAWANNAVMLHFHPLAYYYTPTGLAISITVAVVEALIVYPICGWYLDKILVPALNEGVEKKKTEVIKESYEACSSAYRNYKDVVIAEFKSDNE